MRSAKSISVLLIPCLLLLLNGCAMFPGTGTETEAGWMNDGILVVSRPAPSKSELSAGPALAFMPVNKPVEGRWLSVDRASNSIILMDGSETIFSASARGLESLTPGAHEVLHKQRDAIWHASDSYFERRLMPVPALGDSSRFLRGALGRFALFVSGDLSIHSGPVPFEDLSGVSVDEQELSKIYYSLDVGSVIRVK